MKRFLALVLILGLGAVVVAERYPAIHARVPWLPPIPFVAASQVAPTEPAEGAAGGRRKRFGSDDPIPVLVAPVAYADVPVTAEVLGTVEATNSVLIRPQIDGKLVEIDFKEGQDVRRGDVIARIDPSVYKAAYDGTLAKKAQDEAQLANAQVDLVRYAKLAETQYGSHQQADTQKALVAQYTAQLAQDQASIDNAKATLDFATIRSPIDGRTGIRQVDQGNVVHASDATGIVTVAQVKPIAAVFNLPQQWLRQVNAAMAHGELKLEARDGATSDLLDTGALQVVDNTVDQTTGTVKMKGSFPDAQAQLWPGQFVNLRLTVDTLKHVVVVPSTAVQRGPVGAFVYRVDDGKAVMVKIETGRQTETDTVLTAGLAPPAEVITTGFTRLTDGAKVAVSGAQASAEGDRPDAADAPAKPASADAKPADAKSVDAKPIDAKSTADGPSPAGADRPRRRRRDPTQAGAEK